MYKEGFSHSAGFIVIINDTAICVHYQRFRTFCRVTFCCPDVSMGGPRGRGPAGEGAQQLELLTEFLLDPPA